MQEPIRVRLLDVYRIGLGPSSSHTIGPMRAAALFRAACLERGLVPARLEVELRGSLSATGRGHGTDRAILAGLLGWQPESCDVEAFRALPDTLRLAPRIPWGDAHVPLHPDDVRFARFGTYDHDALSHPNTLVCRAFATREEAHPSFEQSWCSVGGGFVRRAEEQGADALPPPPAPPLHPFHNAASLVRVARSLGVGLGGVVLANEGAWETRPGEVAEGLDRVWEAMRACVRAGLAARGELPGGLGMRRRAADLLESIEAGKVEETYRSIARAQAYAFAVNEENAAGGRVVTAPTNGAAGILPGVLVELADRLQLDRARVHTALATAAAIGMIVKTHASISGAEVGCQGEVGTATAMAAAAICETLGGSVDQAENAAEIAIEHNLGLTCDPLKGLVQAPCIERNAMGVAKAWSAAQLALHSSGAHLISLDRVVKVMKRTGEDMRREYKETSEGGLAVSLPEC
ncbi:MAG: L-serine ammonia-lyase [Planctomycetaceae bacterium]